jgi:hypothetical protein
MNFDAMLANYYIATDIHSAHMRQYKGEPSHRDWLLLTLMTVEEKEPAFYILVRACAHKSELAIGKKHYHRVALSIASNGINFSRVTVHAWQARQP